MGCGRIGTSQRQCQEDLAAKATRAYISYGWFFFLMERKTVQIGSWAYILYNIQAAYWTLKKNEFEFSTRIKNTVSKILLKYSERCPDIFTGVSFCLINSYIGKWTWSNADAGCPFPFSQRRFWRLNTCDSTLLSVMINAILNILR